MRASQVALDVGPYACVRSGVGVMALVAITRDDLDSAGLRAAAAGTSDAKQARRLLALALALDGDPRLFAAQAGGIAEPRGSSGTGRPCGTGSTATTRTALRACGTCATKAAPRR